ncbi:hypothetical protein P8452_60075 [Trifolium repens]|nr:hypothetical protein P8452_60075 [Trifolium repens]
MTLYCFFSTPATSSRTDPQPRFMLHLVEAHLWVISLVDLFLFVAQNKLKSLTMASQPRLQVLAASKNRISTLKGFPYLPVLEHLRVEENPILKMPHLEAASILLVGPTLKKYNDRDLSREEMAIARLHIQLCALEMVWSLVVLSMLQSQLFAFLLRNVLLAKT